MEIPGRFLPTLTAIAGALARTLRALRRSGMCVLAIGLCVLAISSSAFWRSRMHILQAVVRQIRSIEPMLVN